MTSGVTEASGAFAGVGGQRIFWRSWTPAGPARGVIVLVHGAGEHSGRYAHVVSRLVSEGYAVHAADHRGHGRSGGPRAFIADIDDVVADVDTLVDQAVAAQPGLPVVMLGHSMGGLIALRYALAHQARLAGLILSATLAAIVSVPKPLELVGRALSVVAPRTPLIAIDASLVSRDPAVVGAYRADPLVHHGKLPARTAAQLADAVDSLPARVSSITVPALLLYGTGDSLARPAGSEMLAQRMGSADLTVKAYDGLFHEILNEPERDAVLDDIIGWLAARVRSAAPDAAEPPAPLPTAADAAGSSLS